MKKILFITDLIPVGGNTTFLKGLVNELNNNVRNKITFVYFFDTKNEPNLPSLMSGVKCYGIPLNTNNGNSIKILPKRVYLLFKLILSLRDKKFDFAFTDLIYPTFAFQIIKNFFPFLKKIFIFHHIHGSFSEEFKSQGGRKIKQKFFYWLEHWTLKNCNKIFVYSKYSFELTRKLHGILPVEINKPGIDYSFSKDVRKMDKNIARFKLGLDEQKKYILFASRIEPRKGMIAFFENLLDYKFDENVRFIVCSHFFESGFLVDFFDKLDKTKLGSSVFLINSPGRDQLSLLYKAVDVTVMPSTDLETFGFTTLESYYFGTPVVAFDVAANPELIPKMHLVEYSLKNSWQKLYKKIDWVIKNPNSIDYLRYNYSWENYVKEMEFAFRAYQK